MATSKDEQFIQVPPLGGSNPFQQASDAAAEEKKPARRSRRAPAAKADTAKSTGTGTRNKRTPAAKDAPKNAPEGDVAEDETAGEDAAPEGRGRKVMLTTTVYEKLDERLNGLIGHVMMTGMPPGIESKSDAFNQALERYLDEMEAEYGGPWKPPVMMRTGRPRGTRKAR